jgi:hypothetical protein
MSEQRHTEREDMTRDDARDEPTGTTDQERTLQDNIIGQKTTTEGTAGKDGEHAPTGDAAREKTPQGQS